MTSLTLTPSPADPDAAPYVDVLVDDIDTGVASVTVWRSLLGRQFKVRGLVNQSASGIVTIRDFEVAPGATSTYRVEQFDADGAFVSWSPTADAVVSQIRRGRAWWHNPLDPSTAVQVIMLSGAASSVVRANDIESFRIPGRSVGVSLSSGRQGVTKLQLDCYTATAAQGDAFDSLFGGYDDDTVPILCVRTNSGEKPIPPTLFAVIGEPARVPLPNGRAGATWQVSGDETAPPVEAFVVALLDYADFEAFYDDYAAFTAAYVDYTAATRDYSIAGTA